MSTQRLPPNERGNYTARVYFWDVTPKPIEPALGTLDERLEILCRRFGNFPVNLTGAERKLLEEYRDTP